MLLLPQPYTSPREYAQALASAVNSPIFKTLTVEIHHLDLFTSLKPWEKLPLDWQAWFDEECESLQELEGKMRDVRSLGRGSGLIGRPDSLTELLELCRTLPLPREYVRKKEEEESSPLPKSVLVGMSGKKELEVRRFRDIAFELSSRRGLRKAVDIGAGQGYLSRTLSLTTSSSQTQPSSPASSLQLLAIDASSTQILGSQTFGSKPSSSPSAITYLVQKIEGAHSASKEIETWLGPNEEEEGLIIGLHACGKLTDDTIGMFLRNGRLKGLVVVGCCYHHLRSGTGEGCFPTSKVFKDLGVEWSSTAQMAGVQNVTSWEEGAGSEPTSEEVVRRREERRKGARLRTHHRRLLTPLLSHPFLPPTPHVLPLGSLPSSSSPTFRSYALSALTKLNLLASLSTDQTETVLLEADRLEEEFAEDWRWEGKGRVIENLVKILGGLVESTIAMDRYLFLKEQEEVKKVDLVVGWEYEVSPRNLVLVAEKW
ncbi:methyltransferase domain-containing protein [Mrakia frigida]|uniref:methyltransferase domain-containing protein n=1 Tax=Mrakia frigida TaxID=29902 RepID=UPI003FCBFC76